MMVFVDTGGLTALVNENDHHHTAAEGFVRSAHLVPGAFVATDYVLDGTFALLPGK